MKASPRSRPRPDSRPTSRTREPSARTSALGSWLSPLAAAAVAASVFRGALGLFFSQDDFAALARTSGLLPRFVEPWRWLSLQGFFDLMWPLAGRDPLPYHTVSLGVHMLGAALLAALLTRAVSAPAALVGSVFFAAHAASFTALYWISTIGDLGALLLSLLALAAALRADRWRWVALPLYAAALLCKESVLLLPLCTGVVSVWARARERAARDLPPPWRDPLLLAMAGAAVAYAVYFTRANDVALAAAVPGGAPYSARLGPHVTGNLLTYLGWTLNAFLPTVRGWSDAVDPMVAPWGYAALALAAAGALWAPLRRHGWIAALACYAALLLPVLPLAHHTYHYYLLAPLAAAAWGVAALFETLASRGGGSARAAAPGGTWLAAGVLAALLAVNGALLVRKIETAPFTHPELRSEPVVDRARIARRALEGLEAARLPAGAHLVLWSPEARATIPAGRDTAGVETYWERNVRDALYGGTAVRVWFPDLRSVEFSTRPPGAVDSTWVALYRVTGELQVFRAAAVESLLEEAAQGRPGEASRP